MARSASRRTTDIGYRNEKGQEVIRKTNLSGNLAGQKVYVLKCSNCEHQYGANGCDIHIRNCPSCMGGQPGLDFGIGDGKQGLFTAASTSAAFPPRHAISRAYFFLELAERCDIQTRDHCEAFMEAAIVFGRSAILRLEPPKNASDEWESWWDGLLSNKSVSFLRHERNHILHKAPPKVGQIIGGAPQCAAEMYYYETSDIPATVTIRRHVDAIAKIVAEAEAKFTT